MINIAKYIIIVLSLFSLSSFAEDEVNIRPLKASVQAQQPLSIGDESQFTIQLSLASGYHAYVDKFVLKVLNSNEFTVTKLEPSPIVKFMDVFSKKEREGIAGEAQLRVFVRTEKQTKPGSVDEILELTYQACTEKNCLFPTKLQIPIKLVLSKSEISQDTSDSTRPTTSALSFESALQKGVGFTFLFVFLAGILTSLTPCIFPMIPITLSIIGASQIRGGPGSAEAKKPSRFRSFSLSVVYVLGIALTYATLGLIAAKTGALFGMALSNPFVVAAIAIIFIILGLSMYGLYELQMPAVIRDRLSATKTDAGFVGAFVAGLIAGVVASPCVGPVLVSVLTYVAQIQNGVLGFSLLFTFAIGMGLLLIVLGTFSGLAGKLPRSGPWMDFVKFVFGTAMIGMAFFYVKPILPEAVFYMLFGVATVLVASFFGAFEPNEKLNGVGKLRKGSMLALFLLGFVYIVRGVMFDFPFLMPSMNMSAVAVSAESESSAWKSYSDAAFEAAISSGKPVIIDFYANWCAACKELEKFTFSDPNVKNKLKDFALFRVDMTVETNGNSGLKDKFHIMGLPTMHIFNHGKILHDLTLTGFESKDDFISRLNKAL